MATFGSGVLLRPALRQLVPGHRPVVRDSGQVGLPRLLREKGRRVE